MLDKAERKLKRVKINLMRNPKFALWSGILMVGKTEVVEDLPTACTDGYNEKYGKEFIEKLSEKELAFVVLHENLHKAFRHLFIWRKLHDENHKLANMACDYVINLMLDKMDQQEVHIAMPRYPAGHARAGTKMGLLDYQYDNMNAKQVFDLLKQSGVGQGDAGDDGFDDHDWSGANELPEEERKAAQKEIDQAIRQGQIADLKVNGKGAGGMSRALDELLHPEVDWREQMREFVRNICAGRDTSSWRRVSRRYLSSDVYMPTLVSERIGRIVIGADASGSISGRELSKMLAEVKAIADEVKPEAIDLMYWDSDVAQHEVYDVSTMDNIVSSTKPKGGGGTDPTCVSRYIKQNNLAPECIVMLTDGYVGDWGNDWNVPILWAVLGNSTANATVGKTIHIKDL